MPTVTFTLDHAGRPVIELYIGVSSAEQQTLYAPGPIPPAQRVRALVDTGSSRTVVEKRYIDALGLDSAGDILLHSSTSGPEPVLTPLFAVSVALAGERTGFLAADLEILAAADLSGLNVQALLGRDVLNLCLLHYNGPGRQYLLTFPPFEEP